MPVWICTALRQAWRPARDGAREHLLAYTSVGFCVAVHLDRQCEKPRFAGWQQIQTPALFFIPTRKRQRGEPEAKRHLIDMKAIYRIMLSLLLVMFVGQGAEAQGFIRSKVAVYVTGDADSSVKKIFNAKLVQAITNDEKFAVIERNDQFLTAVETENDINKSGKIRLDYVLEQGKSFGAKYVIVAEVSYALDEYIIDSRLINAETHLIEKSYVATGAVETVQQALKLSQEVATGLLNSSSSSKSDISNSNGTAKSNSNSGSASINGHECVDLGLPSGLKWATCNVGASSPTNYGQYFAWGETYTKGSYDDNNSVTYNRYFGNIGGNAQYDAATANWGAPWRLPAPHEFEELINCCTWSFITMGTTNGYKVIGPNGNYIFLPATGCRNGSSLNRAGSSGQYWISTTYENSESAYMLVFYSSSHEVGWGARFCGRNVRPVTE